MRTREVAGGIDHGHDDQPEHQADPDRAQRLVVLRVRHYGAAAGEYERECGEALRDRAPRQVRRRCHPEAVTRASQDSAAKHARVRRWAIVITNDRTGAP